MINIDLEKAMDYENHFYLSCNPDRIAKLIAHHDLFSKTLNVEGDIMECGVFKGASLCNLASLIKIFGVDKMLIGFDIFGKFPETTFEPDKLTRENFIQQAGTEQSIDIFKLKELLEAKNFTNFKLIKGDVAKTLPQYFESNDAPISFVNVDVDMYEPTKAAIECLYPRLSLGGIMMLDDYGKFDGATKAADDYFKPAGVRIQNLSYRVSPSYVVKE